MDWRQLLAEKRVEAQPADKQELDDLRAVIERDLRDASLPAISTDGRFGLAYDASRLLSVMVVRCLGYRLRPHGGGHRNTFLALRAARVPGVSSRAAYLERCRKKRNDASYVRVSEVSTLESDELLEIALRFQEEVESWITRHAPDLGRDAP